VRDAADYFAELPELAVAPDMLRLAEHILDSKAGNFNPATFRDRYEEALVAHLKAKQAGAVPEQKPNNAPPRRIINLMDALRRSVQEDNKRPAAARNGDPMPRKRA
jgi:DNA end-binding protein Ku